MPAGILPTSEVAVHRLEGVEGDVRGAAGRRLLAAGRLAEHVVGVHARDAELLEALVYELVLALAGSRMQSDARAQSERFKRAVPKTRCIALGMHSQERRPFRNAGTRYGLSRVAI